MKRNILTIFGLMLISVAAWGIGVDNSGHGVKALGMNKAFTAVADDPSAIYWNPAGLAFLDDGAELHVYGLFSFRECKYTVNGAEEKYNNLNVIPGNFFSYKKKNLAVGLGFNVPYGGGGAEYENFLGSGYDLKGASGFFAVTPTFAFKLSPRLAVGAGFSLLYGGMERLTSGVETKLSGVAGYGWNVGLLYKASEKFNIGFSVRSKISVKVDGNTTMNGNELDAEAEWNLPYYFTLGFAYKLNPHWTLAFDLNYTLWSQMDKIKFTVAGNATENKTYYDNSYYACIGAEYKKERFALRTGLRYEHSPTKDEGMNPLSCDVDLLVGSVGGAYRLGKKVGLSVAALYIYGFDREYNAQTFHQSFIVLMTGIDLKF